MDEITRRFELTMTDTTFNIAIRAALERGKKILNKYYSLTDTSEAYRIAMGKCFTCGWSCANYALFQCCIHGTS